MRSCLASWAPAGETAPSAPRSAAATTARVIERIMPMSSVLRDAQKGPRARRRTTRGREAYVPYVERPREGANDADGPFSASRSIPHLDGGGGGGHAGRAETGEANGLRPHPGPGALLRAHVDVVEIGGGRGKIAPVVRPPALRALERAPRDEPRRRRLVPEVQPVLPREVVLPPARDSHLVGAPADLLDLAEGDLQALAVPHEADAVPHQRAQARLQIVHALAALPPER